MITKKNDDAKNLNESKKKSEENKVDKVDESKPDTSKKISTVVKKHF